MCEQSLSPENQAYLSQNPDFKDGNFQIPDVGTQANLGVTYTNQRQATSEYCRNIANHMYDNTPDLHNF
jgi:hypothetical protein